MLNPYLALGVGLAIFAAGAMTGHKVTSNAWKAEQVDNMKAAEAARRVDESFSQGVSAAYEGVAAQLRRLAAVNRTEVVRETQKVEYRCPLLPDGERLRIDSIRAANAAAGQPDIPLPADPADAGKGSGRTADSLFGSDGDVR